MRKRILDRIDGQGLVEYSLILMLVAVVVIAVLSLIGPEVGNVFSAVVQHLGAGSGGPPPPPPPECYGSLLLPIMVAVTGLGVGISHWLPKAPA